MLAINTQGVFSKSLTDLAGQYTEQGLEQLIASTDPEIFKNPGVVGKVYQFIASLDPQYRMGAFTLLGTLILNSKAPLFVRMALGNTAFAIPPGFEKLMAKNDLTAADIQKAMEKEVKKVERKVGDEEAYCGNDVRHQIHLQNVHPMPAGDESKDYTKGALKTVVARCYPAHNECRRCFPLGIATAMPVADPVKAVEPDPLDGLDKFQDKAKAEWVDDLFVALLREKHGDPDQGLKGRARRLAQLLAKAVAEKPGIVERMVPPTLPDLGPTVDLSALPEVERFLARLEMRSEFQSPSAMPEVQDKWNEFLQGLPAWGQAVATWFRSLWDDEGTSGDVKQFAKRLLNVFVVLLVVATVVLVVLLGVAAIAMACSITGFFWPSLALILIGMIVVIILRYAVPTYDMPLNAVSGIVDFIDPTDGTGMIGGTVKGFVDMFKDVHRVKPPREDREPISWFTDRSISVAIAWAMVSALGCYFAMVLSPISAPPAAAFMLAGVLWLYAMLETIRKGWRRVGKHDEGRYIPASWRMRLYRGSVLTMSILGGVSFVLGLVLAGTMGFEGSSRLLVTSQTVGERKVTVMAANNGVEFPRSAEECSKGLAQLRHDAKEMGLTVDRICELTGNNDFPCTCR
jgi:hypothetical protein